MPSTPKRTPKTKNEVDQRLIEASRITEREIHVLRLTAMGFKTKEIAQQLCMREQTVGTHRFNIMNKLALRNIADLIRYAIMIGLID